MNCNYTIESHLKNIITNKYQYLQLGYAEIQYDTNYTQEIY